MRKDIIYILYNFGDQLINTFGDTYGENIAVRIWSLGIDLHHSYCQDLTINEILSQSELDEYVSKIQKFDQTYKFPKEKTGNCYVATTVYGSYNCPQVWTLRRYRDFTLAKTWYGRLFIHVYYGVSPTVVNWFGNTDWFKKLIKGKLDRWIIYLNAKGIDNNPYMDKTW